MATYEGGVSRKRILLNPEVLALLPDRTRDKFIYRFGHDNQVEDFAEEDILVGIDQDGKEVWRPQTVYRKAAEGADITPATSGSSIGKGLVII